MNISCRNYREGLVTLAEGGTSEATTLHVANCPDCALVLSQLTEVLAATTFRFKSAPAEVVRLAKSLQPMLPPLRAAILNSSLGLAGVRRSPSESVTVVFGHGEFQARLQYLTEGSVIRIMGEVPHGTDVDHGSTSVEVHEGRFDLTVSDPESTSLLFFFEGQQIEVPTLREVQLGDSR